MRETVIWDWRFPLSFSFDGSLLRRQFPGFSHHSRVLLAAELTWFSPEINSFWKSSVLLFFAKGDNVNLAHSEVHPEENSCRNELYSYWDTSKVHLGSRGSGNRGDPNRGFFARALFHSLVFLFSSSHWLVSLRPIDDPNSKICVLAVFRFGKFLKYLHCLVRRETILFRFLPTSISHENYWFIDSGCQVGQNFNSPFVHRKHLRREESKIQCSSSWRQITRTDWSTHCEVFLTQLN